MTVSLPRLNALTGMVEPATGDPTVRMQSFWNQAMYAIETLQATPGGVSSFNTRVGAITLAGIDVTSALGYIPTSPASLAAALTPYALQSAVVTSLGGAVGAITLGSGLTLTGQTLSAPGGGGGGGGFPLGNIGAIPALSDFTQYNATGATILQTGGVGTPISVYIPDNSTLEWIFLGHVLPAGATWTAIIWIRPEAFIANSQTVGVGIYDPATGNFSSYEMIYQSSGQQGGLRVVHMASLSGSGQTAVWNMPSSLYIGGNAPICMKVDLHGGVISYSHGFDGYNFHLDYSETVGVFITPTEVGIDGVSVTTNPAYWVRNTLLGFSVAAS